MTVLVTGSAGHLGEALMRTLHAENRQALGIDIKQSRYTDFVGSICDRHLVKRCMEGVSAVIHSATLHKPHIATHRRQDFIEANIAGTLILLEEALAAGVKSFIFTSTTSAFGDALTPAAGEPAAWVTEDVVPISKNIYGVTKVAAESLCELFSRKHGLPAIVLRTSRFFPEADDDASMREKYEILNAQANELLYRRVDIEDVVRAHLLAVKKARTSASPASSFPQQPHSLEAILPRCAGTLRTLSIGCFPIATNSMPPGSGASSRISTAST